MVFHVDADSLADWRDEIRPEPGAQVLRFRPADLPVEEFLEADQTFIARIASGELARPSM